MTTSSSTASSRKRGGAVAPSGVNGKPNIVKVRNLKLEIPKSVPLGTFRSVFKEESTNEDVVEFLNAVLGEAQMEQFWALDLDIADGPLPDQVRTLLSDLSSKVQKAIGMEPGE